MLSRFLHKLIVNTFQDSEALELGITYDTYTKKLLFRLSLCFIVLSSHNN